MTHDVAFVAAARERRAAPLPAQIATEVRVESGQIVVTLTDDTECALPLTDRLEAATPAQRSAGRVVGKGIALRWDEIDEDVGVDAFLGVSEEAMYRIARTIQPH